MILNKIKTILLFVGLYLLTIHSVFSQDKKNISRTPSPKLVVGIVIDQMRYDYVYRYWDDYSENGIKKLINRGFSLESHHFDYAPTYTGPGHASIYTGTTPDMHGIIANNWYDKKQDTSVYCVSDYEYQSVGTVSSKGQMSPHRMLTTTITDQLKLANNMRSKTIGISLKDRGSILPVGHTADAAYWLVDDKWITSTRYMDELPPWVIKYNDEKWPEKYLDEGWHLLKNINEYDESLPDNNPHEGSFVGKLKPVFPYDLKALAPDNYGYGILKGTPAGNLLTLEFAKRAIEFEKLGQGKFTDFLAISFSATDYVGHKFGPQSIEAQDTYLKLDLQVADLLSYLDDNVGKGEYLVFFTADHGAVHVPSYLQKLKIPSGYWNPGNMVDEVKEKLNSIYGSGDWVKNYSNDQFFLNKELIEKQNISLSEMENLIAEIAQQTEGVYRAITGYNLSHQEFTKGVLGKIQNGYNRNRSGEVIVITEPGWLQYSTRTGTSHGKPFPYDTHVPLIFYGWHVPQGKSYIETNIKDIAPTLAAMLRIQMPNGCTGKVIVEVME